MSGISKCAKKLKSQIHCPVNGCLFAEGSERYFTEKKFLNQHIAKVHAEKKYSCSKCQKSFGLDWWRKHHEKTCGMIWKCDCGAQYPARESLLTHLRRTNHKLPETITLKENMKQNKTTPKSFDNPVIVLIQPIIQNITCTPPPPNGNIVNQRRILPKTSQPLFLTVPLPVATSTPISTINNTSPVFPDQTIENDLLKTVQPLPSEVPAQSAASEDTNISSSIATANILEYGNIQSTVSTQTTDDAFVSIHHRQSQASQCSRRKPKSLKLGIENHTQTAESVVTKIKKRKSRRKSVAITTETSVLTDKINTDNVFWPGLKDFVLQHAESLGTRLFKSTTSTQTNSVCSKTVCDSETLTDSTLLKLTWEESIKLNKNEKSDKQFQMGTQVNSNSVVPGNIDNQNLQVLNMFTDSRLNTLPEIQTPENTDKVFPNNLNALSSILVGNQTHSSKTDPGIRINTVNDTGLGIISDSSNIYETITNNTPNPNCSMFSIFDNCSKHSIPSKVSAAPTLSDIHTQTIASEVLDYNLLTNMETQTTDDFNFPYLEFSDTETQTPWEDFPNVDDSPLKTDQLSIEIQTDFSSFDPGLNFDPYDLINSIDTQNMVPGNSPKEAAGVNTETQTLDMFCFPQFTNSESQTLDIPDFVFDS